MSPCLGEVCVCQVGNGIHDGVQSVDRDDDHHEAGEVETNYPVLEKVAV